MYIFCRSLFSAVLFEGYSTLGFSFKVELAYIYFSSRSIWHPFVIIASFFHQCSCSFVFIGRWFSRIWWFSQCFQVSTFIFFSFPEQQVTSRFQRTFLNCSKEQCHFFYSIFSLIPNRYTNQPTSRVQFLCACRWHRKPIANFLPLSVFNKYYKYSSKKVSTSLVRVCKVQHANFSSTQTKKRNYLYVDFKAADYFNTDQSH